MNLIRSLPTLQHDPRRPEDLDSMGEDHAVDCLRYAVASRQWVKVEQPHLGGVTMNLLWSLREREGLRCWQRIARIAEAGEPGDSRIVTLLRIENNTYIALSNCPMSVLEP